MDFAATFGEAGALDAFETAFLNFGLVPDLLRRGVTRKRYPIINPVSSTLSSFFRRSAMVGMNLIDACFILSASPISLDSRA